MSVFFKQRGLALGLVPSLPRLVLVVAMIFYLQSTTNFRLIMIALLVATLLLILNFRIRFKIVIFTSVVITFVSILIGNSLLPSTGCPPIVWSNVDAEALINSCGFKLGALLATRRVDMILIGFAWLNATSLSEMASITALFAPRNASYPYRAFLMMPYSLFGRLAYEYDVLSQSIAVRTDRRRKSGLRRFGESVFVTYLKLSAALMRLFVNTPKIAFALAMHAKKGRFQFKEVEINLVGFQCGYEDHKPVLANVNFNAAGGEVILLIGKSRSGKTTLLRALARYIPRIVGFVEGRYQVNGMDWTEPGLDLIKTAPLVRYLSDDPYEMFAGVTVGQEMSFHANRQRAMSALDSVGLKSFWKREIATLSGGERVRLALACVFASQSKMLLLDNPLAQLDDAGRTSFLSALADYVRRERPIVVVADHYSDLFKSIVTRVLAMGDSQVSEGNLDQLTLAPLSILQNRPTEESAGGSVLAGIVGGDISVGGQRILRNLNFEVRSREIVALTGPNGIGKTTAMLALAGVLSIDAGNVFGSDHVGLSFQDPALQFVRLRLVDELRVKCALHRASRSTSDSFLKEQLAWLGMAPNAEILGQHRTEERQTSVASMLYKTTALIIDEPDIELDGGDLDSLLVRMVELRDRGMGIVVITHSPRIIGFCDRVFNLTEYAEHV